MRILALDAALARCAAAVVVDCEVLAARQTGATQGHAGLLPVMARDVLAEAAIAAASLDFVAVTVGQAASPASAPASLWRMGSRWRPVCRWSA